MALFRATVKTARWTNGIRLEKGMTVDFPSEYSSPLSTNQGRDVVEAFQRRYGIDLNKANAVSSSYIHVEKIS